MGKDVFVEEGVDEGVQVVLVSFVVEFLYSNFSPMLTSMLELSYLTIPFSTLPTKPLPIFTINLHLKIHIHKRRMQILLLIFENQHIALRSLSITVVKFTPEVSTLHEAVWPTYNVEVQAGFPHVMRVCKDSVSDVAAGALLKD